MIFAGTSLAVAWPPLPVAGVEPTQTPTVSDAATAADWLSAWSTFAAAIFTGFALLAAFGAWRAARKTLQLELDRDADRQQADRMRDAQHVTCWVTAPQYFYDPNLGVEVGRSEVLVGTQRLARSTT